MRRYRTEILIPPDRTVVLQIPARIPEGWARVTVEVYEPHDEEPAHEEPESQDIEWWDEFGQDDDPARAEG